MKKLKRKRKHYTAWQALNNPGSGVPLVNDAANLEHFWNKNSGVKNADDSVIMTDLRAGFVQEYPNSEILFDGNLIGFELNPSTIGEASGVLTQFALNDDFLFVISGQAADDLTGDDLRFRFGGGEVDTENWVRIRTQKSLAIGDTIYDANGAFIDQPADTGRQTAEMNVDIILVTAYDSTNDELRTQTYNASNALRDDVTNSTVGMAAIDISSLTGDTSVLALGGWVYGLGVWKFPGSTLPGDWSIAALNMGLAWKAGNYTFWPEWGKE